MTRRQLLSAIAGIGVLIAGFCSTVLASANQSTWISHRLIGIAGDNWIAVRLERYVPSYYSGDVSSEIHVRRIADGCPVSKVVLQQIEHRDTDSHGNWTSEVVKSGTVPDVVATMTPVAPSDWRSEIKLTTDGLSMDRGNGPVVIVPMEAVRNWARLHGGEMDIDLRLSDTYEAVDVPGKEAMLFVELETIYRDGDVDYARFIVPVAIYQLTQLLADKVTDPAALAKVQPQPGSC